MNLQTGSRWQDRVAVSGLTFPEEVSHCRLSLRYRVVYAAISTCNRVYASNVGLLVIYEIMTANVFSYCILKEMIRIGYVWVFYESMSRLWMTFASFIAQYIHTHTFGCLRNEKPFLSPMKCKLEFTCLESRDDSIMNHELNHESWIMNLDPKTPCKLARCLLPSSRLPCVVPSRSPLSSTHSTSSWGRSGCSIRT